MDGSADERIDMANEITQIRERLAGLETNTQTILRELREDRKQRRDLETRVRTTEGRVNWLWGVLAIIGPLALLAAGAWLSTVWGGPR